jgi:hypothetical protein
MCDHLVEVVRWKQTAGNRHSRNPWSVLQPILCEASYVLLEYARTAMFMWMFIEGLYLHNRITGETAQSSHNTITGQRAQSLHGHDHRWDSSKPLQKITGETAQSLHKRITGETDQSLQNRITGEIAQSLHNRITGEPAQSLHNRITGKSSEFA